MEIFERIQPKLKKYNVFHVRQVLDEVLEDADEGLTDDEIVELVKDILDWDPPTD